jgi:hypothetical protein
MFVDSLNWLPHSLEKIGQWLGHEKGGLPRQTEDVKTWADYCLRDAEILEKAVNAILDFCQRHDLGVFRATSAGQSAQSYRHRWLWKGLLVPDDEEHKDWERKSYYGGRTELFYYGHAPAAVTTLDVSGFYCSVLRDAMLPSRVLDRARDPLVSDLRRTMEKYGAIAQCLIDSPEHPYPVRLGGRTIYACGRFVTWLCGPELRHALQQGHVKVIVSATTYQLDPIARDYADYWARAREEYRSDSDAIYSQMAKSIPNSWVGKWGQMSSKWEEYPDVPAPRPWYRWPGRTIGNTGIDQYQSLANKTYRRTSQHSAGKSWPAIAAYVTALGRERMDALRAAAGPRNVYYQVVDTLHVNDAGLLGLERAQQVYPGELGYLGVTHTYQDVQYIGINLLRVDGKWHAAGLGRLNRELPDGALDVTTFERLASVLAREPDGSVVVSHRRWRPEYRYQHSVIGKDGWCSPHKLP